MPTNVTYTLIKYAVLTANIGLVYSIHSIPRNAQLLL